MPDYRRLVSYIYNYEDGKKRNNVGYARIEARNGLCKCTLHITAPSLNDKQLKVYFFRRDNGGLNGIQIGTMTIRNGTGDLKAQTDSERIMNSPYSIEQMGGMVLYLSNSKFFATEWDDQPINMEVVSTLEKSKDSSKIIKEEIGSVIVEKKSDLEDGNKKSEITESLENKTVVEPLEEKKDKEDKDEKIKDKEREFSEVKKEMETETHELKKESKSDTIEDKDNNKSDKAEINSENLLKVATAISKQINLKADDLVSQEENSIKEQIVDSSQLVMEDKLIMEDKSVNEDNAIDENIAVRKVTPVTLTETNLTPERDLERDNWEDEMTRKYYEKERNLNDKSDDCDRESQERKDKLSKPFFEDHPTAKYMYNNFERIYPFEDNEVAWCVKIEPQDIGLLPMEAWVLGNNSYLLHGYYSYRHLIFARLNDDKEAKYILGVPGIYHNRERFMARMFGFENFKNIKRKDRRSGEFGYWYVPIMLK